MEHKEKNIHSKNIERQQQRDLKRLSVYKRDSRALCLRLLLTYLCKTTPYTFLNFWKGAVNLAILDIDGTIINRPEEACGCSLSLSHFFKFLSVL